MVLSQHASFTSILLPVLLGLGTIKGRLSEWLCGVSLPAGLKTTTAVYQLPVLCDFDLS